MKVNKNKTIIIIIGITIFSLFSLGIILLFINTNKECKYNSDCVGNMCINNKCQNPCPTKCNDICTNLLFDINNCGSCGNKVPSGTICDNGKIGCSSPKTLCGKECVDFNSDINNCGSCGNKVPSGTICDNGKIGCSSPKNNLYNPADNCNTCINPVYDPSSPSNCTICIKKCGQDDGTGKKCINTYFTDNIGNVNWSLSYYYNKVKKQIDNCKINRTNISNIYTIDYNGTDGKLSIGFNIDKTKIIVSDIKTDTFGTGIQNEDEYLFDPKTNFYTYVDPDYPKEPIQIFPTICQNLN
jgi:hypothetical protein